MRAPAPVLSLIVVFVLAGGALRAQPTAASRLQTIAWDFGILTPGAERQHRFSITNISTTTWTVKNVSKTCACTVGEFSARQVKPSETISLDVGFRAPSKEGRIYQALMVEFMEDKTPLVNLAITGEVRLPLSAEPSRVEFGRVAAGTRPTVTLEVRNYTTQDVAITRIDAPDGVQVERQPGAIPETKHRPRQVWKLVVRADPDKLQPNSTAAALVVHTNAKKLEPLRIPIAYHGQALLTAKPSRLTFTNVEAGQTAEQTVLVEVSPQVGKVAAKDLVFSHALGRDWDLDVAPTASPQLFRVTCRWRPRTAPRSVQGELEITIRNKTIPAARVKIAAKGP